jgi:hypothetical protein
MLWVNNCLATFVQARQKYSRKPPRQSSAIEAHDGHRPPF